MKPELQVCSRESAEKLKALGVLQVSCFYWITFEWGVDLLLDSQIIDQSLVIKKVSAFTCSELGVMLPQTINQNDDCSPYYFNEHKCHLEKWQVRYGDYIHRNCISFVEDNEAEARALTLIHLLENNIIAVEEVNERLRGVE